MKFPKQWLYWAKKAGLKQTRARTYAKEYYFVGHNRNWRVNGFGDFECSCPLEYFDRFANSSGAKIKGIPSSEVEFLNAVKDMLNESIHST